MSKFTPGPWNVWKGPTYAGGGEDLCIGAGEEWLANMDHRPPRCTEYWDKGHKNDNCPICTIDSWDITEEQRANAQLIASAPELLEALQDIRDDILELYNYESAETWKPARAKATLDKVARIDALIAKTKGDHS